MVRTKTLIKETQDMIDYLFVADPATKRRLAHYRKSSVLRGYVTTCRFIAHHTRNFGTGFDFGCEYGVCAYMLSILSRRVVLCYDHSPVDYIINQIPNLVYTQPWIHNYDWIVMNDVLYLNTLDDQQKIIKNAGNYLKKDGTLIISDEDTDNINRNRVIRWCQEIFDENYLFRSPNISTSIYYRVKGLKRNRFYIVGHKK